MPSCQASRKNGWMGKVGGASGKDSGVMGNWQINRMVIYIRSGTYEHGELNKIFILVVSFNCLKNLHSETHGTCLQEQVIAMYYEKKQEKKTGNAPGPQGDLGYKARNTLSFKNQAKKSCGF